MSFEQRPNEKIDYMNRILVRVWYMKFITKYIPNELNQFELEEEGRCILFAFYLLGV